MKEKIIKDIIDRYLQECLELKMNMTTRHVDPEMSDLNQDPDEEWKICVPIESKVSDQELDAFEIEIGYQLPPDYKTFLKHKHFFAVTLSIVGQYNLKK